MKINIIDLSNDTLYVLDPWAKHFKNENRLVDIIETLPY